MNSPSPSIQRSHVPFAVRTLAGGFALALVALFVVAPPTASAAKSAPALSLKTKLITVAGSAANTITGLVFNEDGTISIDATQVGTLSHLGDFTGQFSYLAVPSLTSIVLVGNGTLTSARGEQLFLSAQVVETGLDYPYAVTGVLTVTGGTGRFAGATGTLEVSGTDTESPTDTLTFQGAVVLLK